MKPSARISVPVLRLTVRGILSTARDVVSPFNLSKVAMGFGAVIFLLGIHFGWAVIAVPGLALLGAGFRLLCSDSMRLLELDEQNTKVLQQSGVTE